VQCHVAALKFFVAFLSCKFVHVEFKPRRIQIRRVVCLRRRVTLRVGPGLNSWSTSTRTYHSLQFRTGLSRHSFHAEPIELHACSDGVRCSEFDSELDFGDATIQFDSRFQ
jgi:hypothetical protein